MNPLQLSDIVEGEVLLGSALIRTINYLRTGANENVAYRIR